MRRTWCTLLLLCLALALDGCALPPALVVASYSADIVSYSASRKTLTDHAYSAVARSDCSFIRVLRRKPICVDEPGAPQDVHVADAAAVPAAPVSTEFVPVAARGRYVTLGSFLETANAERVTAQYAAFHPVIVKVVVHGQHFHRVVAGPLSPDEAGALKEKLVAKTPAVARARG
jgi:hypothetical protein